MKDYLLNRRRLKNRVLVPYDTQYDTDIVRYSTILPANTAVVSCSDDCKILSSTRGQTNNAEVPCYLNRHLFVKIKGIQLITLMNNINSKLYHMIFSKKGSFISNNLPELVTKKVSQSFLLPKLFLFDNSGF